MKTAEAEFILGEHCPVFSALFLDKSDKATMSLRDGIVKAMKAYASEACAEQRKNCAVVYLNSPASDPHSDIILNAPEPTLK